MTDTKRAMQLVIQEDVKGCGIACLAMVCGQTYGEVKAKVVPHCWGGQFSFYDVFEYLNLNSYSYQHWYQHARFLLPDQDAIFPERTPWPIVTPFAEAHILLTRGREIGHWVAMSADGEVFDPVHGRGRNIGQYEVQQIIGAWQRGN